MEIVNRNGLKESVSFDKITSRIENLAQGLSIYVKPAEVAMKVIQGMTDGITTHELDELSGEICASLASRHPDYAKLAARIVVSNLQKSAPKSFSEAMAILYANIDPNTNLQAPMLSERVWGIIQANAETLDAAIDHNRDFYYDYFGFKTLSKSYLMKSGGKTIETPQYMLMRVALGIHMEDISAALETYTLLSEKWFTHATPTLFNAGTPKPQMSSCFLLQMKDDSIDGIYDTLKQCAKISQSAGGIGLSIHNVRAKGSYIKGTGGHSNGIVPMLRNFDMTARYVDQGGGKRKGSFAIYLEPWHADISDFLDLKKNHGKEEIRARDLFYALWIPDLFMQRVENNEMWSLMCPSECPGLADVYGPQFEALYTMYERQGKARKTIPAQELWFEILTSQIETGTPYILYKDACNMKSNQKNLGTIKSSNLCTEIVQYTSPEEVAVCNLASLALPKFVENGEFDHKKLYQITKVATRNLNKVIDNNYYPVEEARTSNVKHRPIGLGVQGLADVFMMLKLPFESSEAKRLNKDIFETIYFAAMEASMELAQQDGPYASIEGSPISKGVFQFDMWGVNPDSGRYDWEKLRYQVMAHGVRNSLLVAPMPTASTSQILGNNECFEPYTSNLYTRRTLAGDFIMPNKHLLKDLIEAGLWNENMRQAIIAQNGSIQNIPGIPEWMKAVYKTVWEISQKVVIDMSADRGAFICQSQSLNIHITDPNFGKMSSMHFYGWKAGLKTGMYYLRSTSAADAIKFTLDKTAAEVTMSAEEIESNKAALACSLDNPEACEACGS